MNDQVTPARTGTGLKELNIDLAGSLGGTTGDAAADRVIVNATNADDKVSGNAGGEFRASGCSGRGCQTHPPSS